jgi:hypothetical protein
MLPGREPRPPRFSHTCCMPFPSHPPWIDHSNYVWRRGQVMKLLIMQFSPVSCHLIPLGSNWPHGSLINWEDRYCEFCVLHYEVHARFPVLYSPSLNEGRSSASRFGQILVWSIHWTVLLDAMLNSSLCWELEPVYQLLAGLLIFWTAIHTIKKWRKYTTTVVLFISGGFDGLTSSSRYL